MRQPIPYRVNHHPLIGTWNMMRDRCTNPNNLDFHRYGGRGIKVSAAWPNARAFIDWAEVHLGPRPDGHSLNRIDNDGDYRPGNVQWASSKDQATNRGFTIVALFEGKKMPLSRALEAAGLKPGQAIHAIYRLRKGMSLKQACANYRHLINPSRITIISLPPQIKKPRV
jgi:hypothetical protein